MENVELNVLVRLALGGDEAALDAIIGRYSPRVFSLLYRLTGSRDVAEDLMQETFLRMVRVFEDYAHAGKFEAWLFRIAANLARDHARRRKRRGTPVSLDSGSRDEERPQADVLDRRAQDPHGALGDLETHEDLMREFAKLSAMDREILALRHFGDRSFREIAELLGIPLGTALARAHRALERLRTAMTEDDEA